MNEYKRKSKESSLCLKASPRAFHRSCFVGGDGANELMGVGTRLHGEGNGGSTCFPHDQRDAVVVVISTSFMMTILW